MKSQRNTTNRFPASQWGNTLSNRQLYDNVTFACQVPGFGAGWQAMRTLKMRHGAVIPVRPEHRGSLWSLRGGFFSMDPKVLPIYAIDADRWFDPGQRPITEYPSSDCNSRQP